MNTKIILMFQGPDADTTTPFPGAAGKRFAGFTGLDQLKLGHHFERVDLLPFFPEHKFPTKKARQAAAELKPHLAGRTVIFVGVKIARAFGAENEAAFAVVTKDGFVGIPMPHPSAMNLWWNDRAHVEAAKSFFKTLLKPEAVEA